MSRTQLDKKFAQVAKKIDPQSSLLHAWELKGGVSAQVTALLIGYEVKYQNGDKTTSI